MSSPTIHGYVAEGFGRVADAFRRNFTGRGENGAAVAVFDGDRPVIDLWAGWRDAKARLPWERDTVVPVFSSTKGVSALVLATLVSAGRLGYDAPVARYWPEFGEHGKDRITVRQLIDHRAGLHVLRGRQLSSADLGDMDALAVLLADQRPAWEPGTRQGYHPVTFGLYLNELVRRADPARRTVGRILAEDLAGPLELDFTLGWPEEVGLERIAALAVRPLTALRHERGVAWQLLPALAGFGTFHESIATLSLPMPKHAVRRDFLRPELAGSNGVGTARSLARLYAAAVGGSERLPLSERVRADLADTGPAARRDAVLHCETRYHLGFRKSCAAFPFGSRDDRAYGTPGLGGSLGFADPATGLGFAYVTNTLGLSMNNDPRCAALCDAIFRPSHRDQRAGRIRYACNAR